MLVLRSFTTTNQQKKKISKSSISEQPLLEYIFGPPIDFRCKQTST
jgi:hypothetical protein